MMSMSPTTPGGNGAQHSAYAGIQSPQGIKRRASSDDELDHPEDHDQRSQSRRTTSVKRACNECRQQKLKCNVQQDPFKPCDRCVKQRLRCVIEPNFKRVGKRNRNAEMEKEMEQLREKLAFFEGRSSSAMGTPQQQATPGSAAGHAHTGSYSAMGGGLPLQQHAAPALGHGHGHGHGHDDADYLQTQHQQVAATSLLDLRSGSPMVITLGQGTKHEVSLTGAQVSELFAEFFHCYHPFLPFLDPTRSPDDVYSKDSKLLFWAIISVAARHYSGDRSLLERLKEPLTDEIWRTIRTQPNHHVVKALCLLCTWPLPARTTQSDPTFMLCGVMMQTAMQIGLHQPTHPQDFSRTKVRLQQQDIHDRLRTWAVCNIVAQTVSTGNGQPSLTLYDSTLDFRTDDEDTNKIIPPPLFVRLRQEMAASRINKFLYATSSSKFADSAAATYMDLERDRLKEEMRQLDGVEQNFEELHHRAVSLHLHLYSFFNTEARLERREDLVALYYEATHFLDSVFELQEESRLIYVPYYIMQMSLAAGFALLKLLNSDFATRLPFEQGKNYVLRTIDGMRKAKVVPNDLTDRLAEVLAQLWKESSRGRSSLHSMSQSPIVGNPNANPTLFGGQHAQQRRESTGMLEDPLGLIIRSRMSMSVVFDCVWRWRESQIHGAAEQLDSTVVNNPTNPDSSSNSSPPPGAVIENPAHTMPQFNPHLNTLSMPLQLPNGLTSANSFEIFDPVSWMLDVQNDWHTSYGPNTFGGDFGA